MNTFDYDFPYDPEKALERSINIWDNYASYGSPNVRPVAGILPQSLFFAIGYSIGIPLVVLQRLIFFMILAGSGTSAYILFKIWDKDNAYPRGALFAAILYMFNPIASMFIWNQFTSSYYSYAFLPLIIAFLIIFIRSGSYKWLIIGVLSWTLLITPSYMNPVNAMIDWAVVGSFFLLSGMEKQKRLINIVKLFSILIVIWMMLNAYWIIPQSQYISSELVKANVEDIGISNFELFYSNSAPFSKAFLQTGYWGLYGEYKGDSWYSWGPFASSWIYIVALLVITVVSISEVASNHLRNKKIFLGTLILVCLVLINGVYSPFGGLFIDLFEKYPSLYMFRSAYQRFGPVLALAYSLLFGFACSGLLGKIRKPIRFRKPFQLRKEGKHIVKILVISAVITSLVTISIPYLNGDIILEGGEIVRSAWTEVPDYYFEANEWFTNQGEGYYILPLPYCKLYYAAYDWQQGYWGWEPSL